MKHPLMTLNRDPMFRGLSEMQREMDRLFDDLIEGRSTKSWSEGAVLAPAADVEETDSHLLVSLDVPGVKKDDIHIELTGGNMLHVWAERKEEKKEKESNYRMVERRYGRWERYFSLPESINTEQVEAQYENGVLRIALAKAESAKPREIRIQEGKEGGIFQKLFKKSEVDLKTGKVA